MQISNEIDHLIKSLGDLKPMMSSDKLANSTKFKNVLEASLTRASYADSVINKTTEMLNKKSVDGSPNWVDYNYKYDPSNPRKPNMKEMIEALSGKSVEELYTEAPSKMKEFSQLASELIYGVLGNTTDSRDWKKIMASNNILEEARNETNRMHNPSIDIISELDENKKVIKQDAALKASDGSILRLLNRKISSVEQTLKNFGVTSAAVPADLENRIIVKNFDQAVLKLLNGLASQLSNKVELQSKNSLEVFGDRTIVSAATQKKLENIPIEDLKKL